MKSSICSPANSPPRPTVADIRCSEVALRQPEEAGDRADTGRPRSLATPPPSREELFTFRVQLAEAAHRRFYARSPGISQACLARTEGAETPAPASSSPRLPRLRHRPRAPRAPQPPSLPPAVSWQWTTRSSRRQRDEPPHYKDTTKG